MFESDFTFQPVRNMSLVDWCDTYRRLPAANSAVPGQWLTSRVEAARGPMMSFTEPGVRTITVCSATQLMKTELLLGIIGYTAHLEPAPVLLTQPKEDAARSFSRERVAKMIAATPVLRERFDVRETSASDTTLFKEFPGGFLAITGAGSPMNLAMRAVRITLADEIDKYENTKEGDPVNLLEERASTFGDRAKHVRACSPTLSESSRIWQSYQDSDQRRAFIACPHCQHEQSLHFFRHVQWNKGESGEHYPATAQIFCESCGAAWDEDQRRKAITTKGGIKWNQTRKFSCCGIEQNPQTTRRWNWDADNQVGYACCTECGKRGVSNHHAGYQASKLLSPFIAVPELAEKWIVAKEHPDTKLTFINTQLGEAAEADSVSLASIEVADLLARRENFAGVPHGVVAVTAGIDVQSGSDVTEGRLEVHVVGWGVGDEAWSIAFKIFPGDPTKKDVWNQLDFYLASTLPYERGGAMRIQAACIDASDGRVSQTVYDFARGRTGRKIFAVKGAAERGGSWSPIWPAAASARRKDGGWKPVILGVNSGKATVANMLAVQEPGPAYFHFPLERSAPWFEQLTAEKLTTERKGGFSQRKWVLPRGRANEALDTTVYALAALHALKARGFNAAKTAAAIEAFTTRPEQWRSPQPLTPRSRVRSSAFSEGVRR